MRINVILRHKETGEARVYRDASEWPEAHQAIFMYSEGNYGCDCNRGLFLRDWQGEDMQCSNTGHNLIAIDAMLNRDTGELLYKE